MGSPSCLEPFTNGLDYISLKTASNALSGTSKTWLCGGNGSRRMNSGSRSASALMPAASLKARST